MVTEKSTPANAELVEVVCFELMVTSVRRPMTADGLTTNTLPFPLLVLIATSVWPTHDADAVPEHIPVSAQTPFTMSQVVPLAVHCVFEVHAMAPWHVWVVVGQFALVVQALPPEVMGPHGCPPLIDPSVLLSTQAVRPPAFEYSKLPLL
jgi:hypothetical protein